MDLSTPEGEYPSDPSVAVTPGGRAVVAWWRTEAAARHGHYAVQMRLRASAGAPFVGPTTLSRQGLHNRATPATAASGAFLLIGWIGGERDLGPNDVGLMILPRARRTSPPTLIDEGAAEVRGLRVGVAPDGAAVAVWTRAATPVDPGATDRIVRVATRSVATGAWSGPADLSAVGADLPSVAVAPDGSCVVAWERAGVIETSVRASAGAFSSPVPLSVAPATARFPVVAVNAVGGAVVGWFQDGVTIAERTAGRPFGAPRRISAPGGLIEAPKLDAPALALDADGRIIAAWRRGAAGPFRVEAALRPAGGVWGAPAVLSPPVSRNTGRPAIGAAAGRAVVAWSQPVGHTFAAIRARALPRGGTAFGPLESVSAARGRGTSPSVALDAAGRAVLAWREDPVPRPGTGSGRYFRAAVRLSPG